MALIDYGQNDPNMKIGGLPNNQAPEQNPWNVAGLPSSPTTPNTNAQAVNQNPAMQQNPYMAATGIPSAPNQAFPTAPNTSKISTTPEGNPYADSLWSQKDPFTGTWKHFGRDNQELFQTFEDGSTRATSNSLNPLLQRQLQASNALAAQNIPEFSRLQQKQPATGQTTVQGTLPFSQIPSQATTQQKQPDFISQLLGILSLFLGAQGQQQIQRPPVLSQRANTGNYFSRFA